MNPHTPPFFAGPDAPSEEDLYKCVHCGFCLQACPTYLQTGLETESPRGRIALMKAVNEGRIGITETVIGHWDLCIQCRACEVACPSGVPYGRLIESTMAQADKHRKTSLLTRLSSYILLRLVLPNQTRLSMLASALRLYQNLGLQWALRRSHILPLLSKKLSSLEKASPIVSSSYFKAKGQVIPAVGKTRARVALLSGCVMPLVNGPEMRSVARVLARNGCEIVVPEAQVCCGAINSHVGDLVTARALAKRNTDVFLSSGADAVVVASAGCGIRMKEYGHLLKDDPEYARPAARCSAIVQDILEFLAALPLIPPQGHLDYRVTYQDSCHLSHAQRITEAPRALLNSIPGLDFVEMSNPSQCCGAGGTYTITQRDFSLKLLESKMRSVEATSADVLATSNPGCWIHLQQGVKSTEQSLKVSYVTDLLNESYLSE